MFITYPGKAFVSFNLLYSARLATTKLSLHLKRLWNFPQNCTGLETQHLPEFWVGCLESYLHTHPMSSLRKHFFPKIKMGGDKLDSRIHLNSCVYAKFRSKGSVVFSHTLVQYSITHHDVYVYLKKWVGRVEGFRSLSEPCHFKKKWVALRVLRTPLQLEKPIHLYPI